MHKQLLNHASEEQLKEFAQHTFNLLKETNPILYEELEIELYKKIYGCHFNEWMLAKATKDMINEDGTIGAHWTLEQTNNVAKQYGVTFNHYNEYDWNYVMNMIYSDYYKVIPNVIQSYIKFAKAFLDDKDAKDKAFKYYYNVVK